MGLFVGIVLVWVIGMAVAAAGGGSRGRREDR
jgi:hypothetical protein